MNKIIFSQHSLEKIKILNKHGFKISRKAAVDIMKNPDKIINGYKDSTNRRIKWQKKYSY